MGFASYFLIVWDFVRYARERGIPASARGSACGALVSYVLHLSNVCPLKYDLLFERFLDPNRSEAPDIDIDLCQERRYEVIEYVRKKYGDANVAQIGTFGTMKAKAAIKDVGRVLNIPLARVEQINKLIPTRLNITLEEALKEEPALRTMVEQDPEIERLIRFARRLEGSARNASTHAAGVVIADQPLESLVPLQVIRRGDKDEIVCTQWDMGDVEKAGLLKMDFLGLRNLTTLEAAVRIINERHPDAPLDLDRLPLDDRKTFELLQRGETKGVFQLESAGIRDLLVKMKPDRFADIIATNALYRPGPAQRRHGRRVRRRQERPEAGDLHPPRAQGGARGDLRGDGLPGTGDADPQPAGRHRALQGLRHDQGDLQEEGRHHRREPRPVRRRGPSSAGWTGTRPLKIFDLIEYFGGYGFNKSHSTAYALVAYQTAYLKAHYPTEYMAAVLSSEMDGAERDKFFVEHIDDCRRMGIEVLAAQRQRGRRDVPGGPRGADPLRPGGDQGGRASRPSRRSSRRAQQGGPFLSLDDFFERVSTREVSSGCAETLIRAGAFDFSGGPPRPSSWRSCPARSRRGRPSRTIAAAASAGSSTIWRPRAGRPRQRQRQRPGQRPCRRPRSNLPDVPELPDAELLGGEKKALGFYMSSHPLTRHAPLLQALATHRAAELAGLPDKTEVILGGMIANVQVRNVQKSRSGLTRMAKLTFEDLTGSTPAMLWPEEFAKLGELVKNDLIGFVKGTLDRRREPAGADHQQDHAHRDGLRRAGPRRRRATAQGSAPGRGPRAAAPIRPGPPRTPRSLTWRSSASSTSAARSTRPARRSASATTTG